MPRFLFVSLPLTGHLDWGGMLATASQLARQPGHHVAWASGPAVAAAVSARGIEFVDLQHTGWNPPTFPAGAPPVLPTELRQQRALDAWLNPSTIEPAVAGLLALIAEWRPDAVVLEPYASAAALAAEASRLPIVLCGRPALPAGAGLATASPASRRTRELCERIGVAGRYWDFERAQIRSPFLHVDYFSRRWYADLPQIAPQTVFAGGRRQLAAAPADPPLILVTLGSLFHDDPAFFRIAAEAVLLEGGQPVVVTGRRANAMETGPPTFALPAGCDVRDWIDFDQTLPLLTGIIHHGGVGTTHAAIRHGLPQIAVPHAGDQQAQAGRITQARIGYGVRPADFTLANARWLVRQLLATEALQAQAHAWRDELASLGGIDTAARAIDRAFNPGNIMV